MLPAICWRTQEHGQNASQTYCRFSEIRCRKEKMHWNLQRIWLSAGARGAASRGTFHMVPCTVALTSSLCRERWNAVVQDTV